MAIRADEVHKESHLDAREAGDLCEHAVCKRSQAFRQCRQSAHLSYNGAVQQKMPCSYGQLV